MVPPMKVLPILQPRFWWMIRELAGVLGVAAGIGQDEYRVRTALTYDVAGSRPQEPLTLSVAPKRTNMFVDLSLTPLPLVRIVGELGRVWGGDMDTYNRFDPAVDDPRFYGSVGLRIGF